MIVASSTRTSPAVIARSKPNAKAGSVRSMRGCYLACAWLAGAGSGQRPRKSLRTIMLQRLMLRPRVAVPTPV